MSSLDVFEVYDDMKSLCVCVLGGYNQEEKGHLLFPRLSTACIHTKLLSRVRLSVTPWTVAHQAPMSMGFSRQEYWSGLPCPPPGDLPNPGIEPASLRLLHWQAGSLQLVPPGKPA